MRPASFALDKRSHTVRRVALRVHVKGLRFRVQGLGFRVRGSGLRVYGLGLGFGVLGVSPFCVRLSECWG